MNVIKFLLAVVPCSAMFVIASVLMTSLALADASSGKKSASSSEVASQKDSHVATSAYTSKRKQNMQKLIALYSN